MTFILYSLLWWFDSVCPVSIICVGYTVPVALCWFEFEYDNYAVTGSHNY